MNSKKFFSLLTALIIALCLVHPAGAQEDFGFGFGDEEETGAEGGGASDEGSSGGGRGLSFSLGGGLGVSLGGEVRAELLAFTDGFYSFDNFKKADLGDVFKGKLNFSAGGSRAEAFINLNLRPAFDGSSPVAIDEAYLRGYFGPVNIEGGIRKLTWGRADSFGPLDVVNPLDYTDLTLLPHILDLKIGRPMIHATWSLGTSSTLEGVFVPWFEGDKFASTGRWAPREMTNYVGAGLSTDSFYPSTYALEYAQAGLRFTRNMGEWDLGLQYYFGRLSRPAVSVGINPAGIDLDIDYNYYHQIGVDYAQVLWGFNTRAEAAIHLTRDLSGDKGDVYNPFIGWSLGFDRDIFWQINVNLQVNEKIRLFHSRINDNPLYDTEAGKEMTSTRFTFVVSRMFLRDVLELKVTTLWGVEDRDCLIIPALIWTKEDLSFELCGGIFAGDRKGELGQYRDNSYVKGTLKYQF